MFINEKNKYNQCILLNLNQKLVLLRKDFLYGDSNLVLLCFYLTLEFFFLESKN